MSTLNPTFVHEGNTIIAFFENEVIAKGTNFAAVEGDAVKYLEGLSRSRDNTETANKKKAATHIVTPNGVKGEILSRVGTIWGDEVTVRFENGRIAKFEAHGGNDDNLQYTAEEKQPQTFDDYFQNRLDENVEASIPGLTARLRSLDQLIFEASEATKTASYAKAQELNNIVTSAELEKYEIKESLDHLSQSDAEAFTAPAPFEYGGLKVEQASFGHNSGDGWLDSAVDSMSKETSGVDLEAFLNEGPGQFIAGLETAALADTGVTRDMALSHVIAKTAGYMGDEVDRYREKFLAKAEMARKDELGSRKEVVAQEIEEKIARVDDVPDEGLFL
jgi:hypothetical protein